MKSIVKGKAAYVAVAGATLFLAGCGGKDDVGPAPIPAPVAAPRVAVDGPPQLGATYTIGDVTYTPADVPDYDEVGYASWYGEDLGGRPTANGEEFDPTSISAAHKTLPLPSYVEVTALDTGRTILVRVNDRGPMANDRVLDLSRGAAQQLGLGTGVAPVRVRRVNPPISERTQLRSGNAVPERAPTPDSLLSILRSKLGTKPIPVGAVTPTASKPTPDAPRPGGDRFIVEGPGTRPAPPPARPVAARPATPAPAPAAAKPTPAPAPAAATGSYVVQVAAFGVQSRATAAARSVGGTTVKAGNVWRVRMGPFASEAEATSAAAKAKAKGFRDARVMRDR